VNFLPYDPARPQDRGAGQGVAGEGEIGGVVIDQNGAVIPGASVTATNTETGVKAFCEVRGSGTYSIAPLPAGNYNVEAVAPGFRRVFQENVQVSAGQKVGLNLRLAVGEVNENLNITGALRVFPDSIVANLEANKELNGADLHMILPIVNRPLPLYYAYKPLHIPEVK
jgi:hypothetical protein